ncbi:MAG TPA: glycosyltransferase [Chryseolinea sp.]|nr:glycosyltransferase [Chryseolinea sp.]
MPKRVVFLCYHGIGHINPCFPLARILEQQGHAVTIATVAHFNGYVTRAGFTHYALKSVPFGLGFESWVNTERNARFLYWANLRDRYHDQLYREREDDLMLLLNDVKPDVILMDATQATDFIVLYPIMKQRGISHAMFHAMFPTHVLPGRPPANSLVVPGNPNQERAALAKMQRRLNRSDLKQRLLYFGMSDRYLINRRLHQNHVPLRFQLTIPSLFDFQVDHVPAFILAPRKFDYPDFDAPTNHHYIGFIAYDFPISKEARWSQAKTAIRDRRAAGSRLVYCSFGTIGTRDEKRIDAFLIRLADAITEAGNLLVISMAKERMAPVGLERDNVWVFPTVPQTEVLRCSDVFVTHGGLSSIKEAIDAAVPMLMVPVHHQFDPPGNAARVQFHGMGLLGDIHDHTDQLKGQLEALLNNSKFRSNIEMIRETNKHNPQQRFLELFDSLVADGPHAVHSL